MSQWQSLRDAPLETDVLLAAISRSGEWVVGEARLIDVNESGEPTWWWASARPGDYHSDDVVSMGATPSHWMPMPEPPARTEAVTNEGRE